MVIQASGAIHLKASCQAPRHPFTWKETYAH